MDATQTIAALAALAQEHRLQAFRFLVQRGADGAAAGVIADHLAIPASSLSFHLAQLERAGLVVRVRKSRSLIYSADFANRAHTRYMPECQTASHGLAGCSLAKVACPIRDVLPQFAGCEPSIPLDPAVRDSHWPTRRRARTAQNVRRSEGPRRRSLPAPIGWPDSASRWLASPIQVAVAPIPKRAGPAKCRDHRSNRPRHRDRASSLT